MLRRKVLPSEEKTDAFQSMVRLHMTADRKPQIIHKHRYLQMCNRAFKSIGHKWINHDPTFD